MQDYVLDFLYGDSAAAIFASNVIQAY